MGGAPAAGVKPLIERSALSLSPEPFFENINHITTVFSLYETTHPDPDGMWYRICSGWGVHKHCFNITCGNPDIGTTCNANGTGTGTSTRFKYR